jgi:apolipoprotein N-acyltransferase
VNAAWQRWEATGLLALAGVLVGLGHRGGSLAVASWLGIAVAAAALRRARDVAPVVTGLLLGCMLEPPVGFPWNYEAVRIYIPWRPVWLWWLVIDFLYAVTLRAPVFVAWLVARWRGWPAWSWLPLAWAAGEALHDVTTGMSYHAWLYAQWQVPWVLSAAAMMGWVPTMVLCLGAASAVGDAVVSRSRSAGALAAALAVALLLFPALPRGDTSVLDDVGAVHMDGYLEVPARAPEGVGLLVFPERAQRNVARMAEGPGAGRRISPPLSGPAGVARLEGLLARTPDGFMNALVALSPHGEVLGVRGKRVLFPFTERPWMGLTVGKWAGRLVPGKAPFVLEVAARRAAGFLCFEALERGLVEEGAREGADLLVVAAIDNVLAHSPLAAEQILAVSVFRAVETGLPLVRASLFGPAAFISADGRILASSAPGTSGVLTVRGDTPLASLGTDP